MIPKFRAWDLIDNRMRYDIGVIEFNGINKNVSALSFNFALDDTGYGEVDNSYSEYYDANCFELMQSTGLKDMNGTEIYEGDIVENSYKEIGFIKNSYDAFCFNRKERNFYLSGIGAGRPFKILGNIYENPELLEGE